MPEPGLRVVTASRLEPLADRLAAALRAEPLGPLDRETVVVARKEGVQAWTRRALAARLGVAASLDLRSPRDLTGALARRLVPDGTDALDVRARPFEPAALAWRLRDALADLPAGPAYDRVRVYLARAADRGEGPLPLATRLAALYDEYQVYRPALLAAWAEGRTVLPAAPDEPWQADLWRHLVAEGPGLDRATHLARLIDALDALPDGDALRARLGPAASPLARVSLVGALALPPLYARVLAALARLVPVTVYAVAYGLPPDPYAPGPAQARPEARPEARHPLLRDLGGAPPLHALRALGQPAVTCLDAEAEAGAEAETRAGPHALGRLQAALAADRPPDAPAPCDPHDRSLRVLDCHSPLRELEVLRDELLDAFDTLPGLRPDDVAVLVPDLVTYAPLVDAVFADAAAAGAALPVHVADHPFAPELRVLDAFHRVLALDAGRAAASEVVGLLDVPAVRRAAGIREDELATVFDLVREARVHWGRDGAHKAAHGLGDDDVHTWRFGLDRLLLGVAVGPAQGVVLGRRPVADATLDAADLVGRLAEWATALFGRLETLREARAPAAWADALVAFVDDVFEPRTDAELAALVALRTALDGLSRLGATLGRRAGADGERLLTAGDVRHHLATALAAPDRHEPYLTGKITVADPLALRHAPFRVVAVLGLGDAFPRATARPDFDLIGADPQPGDHDAALVDRQTVLDALMAARDRLLLSYVGRSHHDNRDRAPSAVLDAVAEAVRRAFGPDAAGRLVVRHALQPFSDAYAAPPPAGCAATHFTYAARPAAPPGLRPPGLAFHDALPAELSDDAPMPDATPDAPAVEETPVEETTADALARAWANPSRAYCDALGLDLRLDDAALDDDEPVELDGLARHGARADALGSLLGGATAEEAADRLVRSGRLPPGPLADAYAARAVGAAAEVAAAAAAHGPLAPLALDVDGGRWRLTATVHASPARGALLVRAGRVTPAALVHGWVHHLALCASGARAEAGVPPRTTVVGAGEAVAFAPVPPDEARAVLQFLVRGALLFAMAPPPLFLRASHAHATAPGQRARWRDRHAQIVRAEGRGWRPVRPAPAAGDGGGGVGIAYGVRPLYDGTWEPNPDRADPAVALCTRRRDPLAETPGAFDRWALALWGPLMAHVAPDA